MLDFDRMVAGPGTQLYGVRVRFRSVAGQSEMLSGVFDRRHVEVGFGQDGAVVSASESRIMVRLSEWGAPRQGDAIDVRIRRGRATHIDATPIAGDVVLNYLISDVQHDAIGGALLILGARALSADGASTVSLPFTPGGQAPGS